VRAAHFLTAFILALFFADPCAAQTLYKWIDKDGRVQFADKPPVGFKGEVTKIQVDAQPDPVTRVPYVAPAPKRAVNVDEEKKKPPDIATLRRQQRELLGARVEAARTKLEGARKALSDGGNPVEDERDYVRQDFPRDARSPEKTPPPRTNCSTQTTTDGRAVWNCPRPIPNETYFERQKKLEDAVRQAEEELEDAERAYRRGVD
jgi:hypothetical protein